MARTNEPYVTVIVESFRPASTAGLHGEVHIRPIKGQGEYSPDMHVQCSENLKNTRTYPLGTKFKIRAKINDKEGGKPFLYSNYTWPFEVIK